MFIISMLASAAGTCSSTMLLTLPRRPPIPVRATTATTASSTMTTR